MKNIKNQKIWVGEGRLGKPQLHWLYWLHRLQTPYNGLSPTLYDSTC